MKKEPSYLLFVIALILLLHLTVSIIPNRNIDGDLSILVLMAKHTIEKGTLYYFYYGQHYNGGAAIFSYMITPFIFLFGVKQLSFYLANLTLSILFFILIYFITKSIFSTKIANLTSLFLIFSAKSFLIASLGLPPYIISMVFNIIILYLFYKSVVKNGRAKYFVLLGIISALSHWILEFSLPLLALTCFFWFLIDKRFIISKGFRIFFISLIIGEIPLIIYNITHNFANIKQLLAGTAVHRFVCKYNLIPEMVRFGDRVVDHCKIFGETVLKDTFHERINTLISFFGDGVSGFIYMTLILAILVYLAYINLKYMRLISSDLLRFRNTKIKDNLFIEIFIISYIALYSLSYTISGFSDTKHLIPIYPFLALGVSIGINRLTHKINKFFIAAIMILIIMSSIISAISLINSHDINDETEVLDFLSKNDINYVYTTYFIKWELIFQSNEKVISSCEGLCPCAHRYPRYDEIVNNQEKFAIILWNQSNLYENLILSLSKRGISYNIKQINEKSVLYNLSVSVRPKELIDKCTYNDGLPI